MRAWARSKVARASAFAASRTLRRLGLSLAPLRFALGGRFAAHREDALFALLIGRLGLLD